MQSKAPTPHIKTVNAEVTDSLPFEDSTDFDDADRGFLGALEPCVIKAADGRVVWDNDSYAFLRDDAPPSVHPSLWRQSQLAAKQGLYEVVEGIYQVRGLDLSNISFIEGDTGVIVVDPLISTETAAALLGPFWRMRSPETPNGGSLLRSPTPGPALFAGCRVVDPTGKPMEGVEVDVWHSSTTGMYENQDPEQAEHNLRGKFHTDAEGRFSFRSILPAGYPIPVDGPVGDMVLFQKREPWRPAHIHFLLHKPGFKTLVTQVFVQGAKYLETDVVFGVTKALVGDYRRHETGTPPAPDVTDPWYTLDYTFLMEEGESGLPKPPIK
jgi:protocatechuate 3,4-dioxygenase beta subunit